MRTIEDCQKIVEGEPHQYGNAGLLKIVLELVDTVSGLKSQLARLQTPPPAIGYTPGTPNLPVTIPADPGTNT